MSDRSKEPLISLSTSENFESLAATRWGGVSKATKTELNSSYVAHKLVIGVAKQMLREKRQNSLGETLRCDFGFVETETSDAFAEYIHDQHAFGLNAGLVTMAYYLAGELFLVRNHKDEYIITSPHPDLHRFGGNISLTPDDEQLYALARHSGRVSKTVNKKRLAVAQYFREFFLLFALFHEYHHVIWGHCNCANATIGTAHLHEVGATKCDKKDNTLLHNLEYMADTGAIDLMVWYVNRRSALNIKWISIPYADLHRLTLFAVGIMCAVWHAHDCKQGSDGSHPPLNKRFLNILANYITRISPKGEKYVEKICLRAFHDLGVLSGVCPDIKGLLDNASDAFNDGKIIDDLKNRFNACRNETVRYEFLTDRELKSIS